VSLILHFRSEAPDYPPREHPDQSDDGLPVESDEFFLQSLTEEIAALKEDARKILRRRLQLIQRRKALLDTQRTVPCS
jgi:hypothetical protein